MSRLIKLSLFGFLILSFVGCSSASKVVESPVQTVVTEPAAEPEPEVQQAKESVPVAPAVSEQLQALRNSISVGDAAEIERIAHQIIDSGSEQGEQIEALRALSQRACAENRYEEARLYAEAAYGKESRSAETLMLLARISRYEQKNDEAVKRLREAIETDPGNPKPYLMKAAILLEFLDVERALADAKKARELDPADCSTGIVLADAFFAAHQFEDAASEYEKTVSQNCSLSEASLANLAKLYEVHLQNPKKACSTYQQLTQMAPDNAYYKASKDYQCSVPENES